MREEIYNKIKLLLDDEDLSDDLLEIYVDRAISSIYNYMNNPRFNEEIIMKRFGDVVVAIVEESVKSKETKNIKQVRQGPRYVTYTDTNGMTINPSIKSMLPPPYARVY